MLYFEAAVRPNKAEALCRRLIEWGQVFDLTACEVQGVGRRTLGDMPDHDAPFEYLPKIMLTGAVRKIDRDELIEIITATARSGRRGDGKIFIFTLDHSPPLA